MLERYYVRPKTVDRIQSSWISGAVEQYVTLLAEQKYSDRCVFRRIPLLVGFGEFARARGAETLEDLPFHVEAFITSRAEREQKKRSAKQVRDFDKSVRGPVQQMLRLVVPDFVGNGRHRKPENPFQQWAPSFFAYLREEKGLRETSIAHYTHYLRQFASYLQTIQLDDLKALSPPVLSGFVIEFSRSVRWASLRNACGVLHVFLRYLYRERTLDRDLSNAVERPQTYRLSNIPRSITWEEVRRMLEAVDRRSPRGKRDYAILLLLVFGNGLHSSQSRTSRSNVHSVSWFIWKRIGTTTSGLGISGWQRSVLSSNTSPSECQR
jgi:hypothetical protein